jgi:hypothetical protein
MGALQRIQEIGKLVGNTTTDYGKQETVKDGFLSTDIELISQETILVSREEIAKHII